jgi:hypothetical protein
MKTAKLVLCCTNRSTGSSTTECLIKTELVWLYQTFAFNLSKRELTAKLDCGKAHKCVGMCVVLAQKNTTEDGEARFEHSSEKSFKKLVASIKSRRKSQLRIK